MKKLLILLSIILYTVNGMAQCADSTGFGISLSNSPAYIYLPADCNLAPNINNIRVNDGVYLLLTGVSGYIPNEVTWKDGGVQIAQSSMFPEAYELYTSFSTVGTHKITCDFDFGGSCTITKTLFIDVQERECPFVDFDVSRVGANSNYCFNRDTLFLAASVVGFDIPSVLWSINSNNNTFMIASGDTLEYVPMLPGPTFVSGVAMVELTDSTFCYAEVGGTGCSVGFSVNHADPFFELEGDFFSNQDIDVVFQGSNSWFLDCGNEYELFLNSVSQTTGENYDYNEVVYTFSDLSPGTYEITLEVTYCYGIDSTHCVTEFTRIITIEDSTGIVSDSHECDNCNTFKPGAGEKYWISAWVKEDRSTPVKGYTNAYVNLDFQGSGSEKQFRASGELVEGWQRIVGSFVVPSGTTDFQIELVNDDPGVDAYFDDIRIHPFNASMKSYVYDPVTLWLTAELDDNNYATFYEYDSQGQLVRIKKETSRGVMTIQESRSSNPKVDE